MQRTTATVERDVIDVDAFVIPVVDVDQHYAKYEYDEDADGIQITDRRTFQQSVRRSKSSGKEKEKDAMRTTPVQQVASTSTSRATSNAVQSRFGSVDRPSTIGPAIQNARQMQQKRAISSTNQPTAPFSSNKRRKLDSSPSPSIPPSPLPSSSTAKAPMTPVVPPVAVPSKLGNGTPSPFKVKIAEPASPDLSFVPYVSKVRASLPIASSSTSGTVPQPALPRTQTTSANVHVNTVNGSSSRIQPGASTSTSTSGPQKRVHEVIDLSSGSEGEVEVLEFLTSPNKKQKRSTSPLRSFSPISVVSDVEMQPPPEAEAEPEFEDEDDYGDQDEDDGTDWNWNPPGWDLNDTPRWTLLEVNRNRLEDDHDVTDDLKHLTIADPTQTLDPLPRYIHPDTSVRYPRPVRRNSGTRHEFIWVLLNRLMPSRPRPRPHQMKVSYSRPWNLDFHLHRLKRVDSFKEAPGSINRIEQKGLWTVISSACDGGLPDVPDEQTSQYNRRGSLMTWNGELDIPEGHELKRENYRESYRAGIKHYAVHDVKWDPNNDAFVSSGADKKVRRWTLSREAPSDEKIRWESNPLETFNRPPHELSFKPNTSVLAVAEKKVHIYSWFDHTVDHIHFSLHSSKAPHIIGAMAWGLESTSDHLFASSEPSDPNAQSFEGLHKVYDVISQTSLYSLDATEAGDTLAVDPTGGILALSTQAPENRHILRLYDVRRRESKATAQIDLETFPIRYENFEGEVNCSTFSPDGVYLALARNDNFVHIYDTRMLDQDRGPLFKYEHFGESKAPSSKSTFGVVKAQWLHSRQTRRIALVSAGEDGCVRLWNPLLSSRNEGNGTSIAEVNSDIGYFSLGDRFADEHELVVGDCAGEVTIFDNIII